MAANQGNVDVITDVSGIDVPSCAHGPALLFVRYDQTTQAERKFFACSAFRDRKVCPFFQWADIKKDISQAHQDLEPSYNHKEMRKRFLMLKKMKKKDRNICLSCGSLLLPEERDQHVGHQIRSDLPMSLLRRPTQLFCPLDSNKTYAQYLFSDQTVNFVLSTMKNLGITHVLAVGCPRIHEAIQLEKKQPTDNNMLESILMDLDHRYVYSPSKFCRYNMLNHHFFGGEKDKKTVHDFLHEHDGKHVAIVIDPPFGVMVEALGVSLEKIQSEYRHINEGTTRDMPVLWFFPYFMERRVLDSCQGYTILDYKVDYNNHALFKGDSRRKGSPVRIFTNLHPREITLPESEGYWFCDKCDRYSAELNKHCDICECCPTKDGYTYRHCNRCGRCVKPSRVHCDTCKTCDLPQHVCGQVRQTGCHICGEEGHKRRECPQKNMDRERSLKRKRSHGQTPRGKQRKK